MVLMLRRSCTVNILQEELGLVMSSLFYQRLADVVNPSTFTFIAKKLSPHLSQHLAAEVDESDGSLPSFLTPFWTSSGKKMHFISFEYLFRCKKEDTGLQG